MRALGTELNMLKRLGFVPSVHNLSCFRMGVEEAAKAVEKNTVAHAIYAVTYRGKRARNKTPLHVELQPSDVEFFKDDASFFKRTNELYAMGCYWIGAFHKKD